MADSTPNPDDPRGEYAALLRAAAARLELEQQFGIESWNLPRPAPRPAPPPAARAAGASRPAVPPRPAAPRGPATPPEPRRRAAAPASANLLTAQDYTIQIPEGLSKQEQLDTLARAIADCQRCPLCSGRSSVVFGEGDPDADLMFIGEAPGHDEDVQGRPFVGKAGQLLTRIIEAMGFQRSDVYIANICKCRPPNNRAPTPDEMSACVPFLLRQVEIVRPKAICLLGATAVRGLLDIRTGITKLRGHFIEWRGIQVMPTFHPAYLLRYPGEKRLVWEDVQKVRDAVRGT